MTVPLTAFTSELQIQSATLWKNVSPLLSITANSVANSVQFIKQPKLKRTKIKLRKILSSASMSIGKLNKLTIKINTVHKLVLRKRLLKPPKST
jgi:hypothetical protein